jgi:ubiquinone/menaquinone biosynthesis C-methylase UbiE
MKDYYAARAAEYDRIYLKPERQADLRAIEAWLPEVFAGRRLLEIACGTGYWTQWLASACLSVTGIDTAEQTLAIARTRPANQSVRLLMADAFDLPDSLGSFDAAFAGFWISHLTLAERRPFFEQLHRRLTPGAVVVMLDNRFVPGSSTPIARTDRLGNTWQQRSLDDGRTYEVLKNFPDEAQLRAALEGLADQIEWREWPYYWTIRWRVGRASPVV